MATTVILTLIAFVVIVVVATSLLVKVTSEKTHSKNQPKKIIVKNKNEERRIDPDKIAKALGAEYVGKSSHKAAGGYFGAMDTAANRPMPPTIIEPASTIIEAKDDIQIALALADLPTDPQQIIGQMFRFQATLPRSVNQRTIIGTITGVEISNLDQGINLFLSARQFNGVKIERLHIEYNEHLNERDYALILKDGSAIPGQFRLM